MVREKLIASSTSSCIFSSQSRVMFKFHDGLKQRQDWDGET